MTNTRQGGGVSQEEPMGIVISRGSRAEPTPRVLAYVYGPAPEPDISPLDARAA